MAYMYMINVWIEVFFMLWVKEQEINDSSLERQVSECCVPKFRRCFDNVGTRSWIELLEIHIFYAVFYKAFRIHKTL